MFSWTIMGKKLLIIIACFAAAVLIVVFVPSFITSINPLKATVQDTSEGMKSIMGVMSLGIPTQSEITVSCEGDDEDVAIKTIEDVLRAQKVIA